MLCTPICSGNLEIPGPCLRQASAVMSHFLHTRTSVRLILWHFVIRMLSLTLSTHLPILQYKNSFRTPVIRISRHRISGTCSEGSCLPLSIGSPSH